MWKGEIIITIIIIIIISCISVRLMILIIIIIANFPCEIQKYCKWGHGPPIRKMKKTKKCSVQYGVHSN